MDFRHFGRPDVRKVAQRCISHVCDLPQEARGSKNRISKASGIRKRVRPQRESDFLGGENYV